MKLDLWICDVEFYVDWHGWKFLFRRALKQIYPPRPLSREQLIEAGKKLILSFANPQKEDSAIYTQVREQDKYA